MTLREFLNVADGFVTIVDDEVDCDCCTINLEICNPEYYLSEHLLDKKVMCAFVRNSELNVMVDQR